MIALELTRTPYTSGITAGSAGTMDVPVRVRAPAHAWRNRWQAVGDASHYLDNDPRKAGEVYWSRRVCPSREIAEQIAVDDIRHNVDRGFQPDFYLGAYPFEGAL